MFGGEYRSESCSGWFLLWLRGYELYRNASNNYVTACPSFTFFFLLQRKDSHYTTIGRRCGLRPFSRMLPLSNGREPSKLDFTEFSTCTAPRLRGFATNPKRHHGTVQTRRAEHSLISGPAQSELKCEKFTQELSTFKRSMDDSLGGPVVRVHGYRSRGLGSIPGTRRFPEKQWVWNGVHSASWVQLRSYLQEKVATPV
jgi:hypothetical protein